AEPHDADCGIGRVAATDLLEMVGVRFGAARRDARHAKGEVANGHADAENAWRNLWRPLLKFHPRVRHVGTNPDAIDVSGRRQSYAPVFWPPCTQRPSK